MEWRLLGQIICVLAVGGNVFAYWIKAVNSSKGHGCTTFGIFRDLRAFAKVIEDEKDLRLQNRYKLILWAFYACVLAGVVTVLMGGPALWWFSHGH